jgi:hypothetical protein
MKQPMWNSGIFGIFGDTILYEKTPVDMPVAGLYLCGASYNGAATPHYRSGRF